MWFVECGTDENDGWFATSSSSSLHHWLQLTMIVIEVCFHSNWCGRLCSTCSSWAWSLWTSSLPLATITKARTTGGTMMSFTWQRWDDLILFFFPLIILTLYLMHPDVCGISHLINQCNVFYICYMLWGGNTAYFGLQNIQLMPIINAANKLGWCQKQLVNQNRTGSLGGRLKIQYLHSVCTVVLQ